MLTTDKQYFCVLWWHKVCVFVVGLWVNWKIRGTHCQIPLSRLFFHDWVKFLPFSEVREDLKQLTSQVFALCIQVVFWKL